MRGIELARGYRRRMLVGFVVAGVLIAFGGGGGASAATVKNATEIPYMYVTQYIGSYLFSYHYTVMSTGQTYADVSAYQWDDNVEDTVTPSKAGKFQEKEQLATSVDGERAVLSPQQIPNREDCDYSYEPLPHTVFTREGSYNEAVPVKHNPKLTVFWSVPQPGVKEPGGADFGGFDVVSEPGPKFSGSLCSNSDEVTASSFLGYTESGCVACQFSYPLGSQLGEPTATFRRIWSGSQTVALKHIYRKSFTRSFQVAFSKSATSGSAATNGLVKETATLKVSSRVSFWRQSIDSREYRRGGNKVGALLLRDALDLLGARTDLPLLTRNIDAGTGLGFQGGVPDSIVLPGVPAPGTVSAEVTGTVTSGGHMRRARWPFAGAAAALQIARGSARTDPSGGLFAMKLTPGAGANELLSGAHPPVVLRATLIYHPKHGSPVTVHVTATLPGQS